MGHMSGAARRLQDEEPAAIAVHCLAYSVNLVLQDITKLCRPVKDALDVMYMIVSSFTKKWPKCSLLLASHIQISC